MCARGPHHDWNMQGTPILPDYLEDTNSHIWFINFDKANDFLSLVERLSAINPACVKEWHDEGSGEAFEVACAKLSAQGFRPILPRGLMDLNRGWKGREEAAESLGQQDFLGIRTQKVNGDLVTFIDVQAVVSCEVWWPWCLMLFVEGALADFCVSRRIPNSAHLWTRSVQDFIWQRCSQHVGSSTFTPWELPGTFGDLVPWCYGSITSIFT